MRELLTGLNTLAQIGNVFVNSELRPQMPFVQLAELRRKPRPRTPSARTCSVRWHDMPHRPLMWLSLKPMADQTATRLVDGDYVISNASQRLAPAA